MPVRFFYFYKKDISMEIQQEQELVKRIKKLAKQNQELEEFIKKLQKESEKLRRQNEKHKALLESLSTEEIAKG